ncbi:MAG: hypothetical protein OEY69_07875 [Candidatus Krumholzibacteria bacterium]|nr:hypothetical protein [Candidatus Krumholzibacteria bacterium]
MAGPGDITAKVDDGELRRKLARASRVLGKEVGELVRFYSGPAILDLMRTFPPMGTVSGKEAFSRQRQLGVQAVTRDIAQVYRSLASVIAQVREAEDGLHGDAARGLARAVRRGEIAEARGILRRMGFEMESRMEIGTFDAGHHKSSRAGRGRVRRRRAAQIVTDAQALRAYVRAKVALVGTEKAGFLAGHRAAGGKGSIPRWITRHGSGRTGRAQDLTRKALNPRLVVTNAVPYAAEHAGGLVGLSLARSRRRMLRGMDAAVRRKLRALKGR